MALRNWLNHNKVFFEVLASTLLGVAGIIVSYASLRTAQTQAALQRAQLLPRFRITTGPVFDPASGRFLDEELTLHNDGYPVQGVKTRVRTAYEIRPSVSPGRTSHMLPIYYYSGEYPEFRAQGHLLTYRQPFNNDHALRLLDELGAFNRKRGPTERYDVEMVTIVSISYIDDMEQECIEYYRLDALRGGVRISEASARAWIERYELLHWKLRSLSGLHAEGLIESALAKSAIR